MIRRFLRYSRLPGSIRYSNSIRTGNRRWKVLKNTPLHCGFARRIGYIRLNRQKPQRGHRTGSGQSSVSRLPSDERCRQRMQSETVYTKSCVIPSTAAAVGQLCREILDTAKERGFGEQDLFAIHLALEKAFMNAVRHGNQSDPSKNVTVELLITLKNSIFPSPTRGAVLIKPCPDPRQGENLYQDRRPGRTADSGLWISSNTTPWAIASIWSNTAARDCLSFSRHFRPITKICPSSHLNFLHKFVIIVNFAKVAHLFFDSPA